MNLTPGISATDGITMNAAIVEDTQVSRDLLSEILAKYAAIQGIKLDISAFASGEELLADYRPLQYTVIFFDIFLDGMNGVDAAEKVRETDSDTLIVFITSSGDHMPHAFRFHAFDYIQKPFDNERIYRVMDDILKRVTRPDPRRLFFTYEKRDYALTFSDIVCVRAEANYVEISDRNGDVYHPRMTFSSASAQLTQDSRFLLLMRGVLANMDYIESISADSCELKDGVTAPINIRNAKKIEQVWKNYRFSLSRDAAVRKITKL